MSLHRAPHSHNFLGRMRSRIYQHHCLIEYFSIGIVRRWFTCKYQFWDLTYECILPIPIFQMGRLLNWLVGDHLHPEYKLAILHRWQHIHILIALVLSKPELKQCSRWDSGLYWPWKYSTSSILVIHTSASFQIFGLGDKMIIKAGLTHLWFCRVDPAKTRADEGDENNGGDSFQHF